MNENDCRLRDQITPNWIKNKIVERKFWEAFNKLAQHNERVDYWCHIGVYWKDSEIDGRVLNIFKYAGWEMKSEPSDSGDWDKWFVREPQRETPETVVD